jgi:hypothetical protein
MSSRERDFSAMAKKRDEAREQEQERKHPEILARIALIRPLKRRWPDIPLAILDRVLPPVECRRTRYRLAALAAGRPDLPNTSCRERR